MGQMFNMAAASPAIKKMESQPCLVGRSLSRLDCSDSSTEVFSFSLSDGVDSSVFSAFFSALLPTTCVTSMGVESVGGDFFSSSLFCFSSIFVKAEVRSDISAIAE